MTAPSDSVIYLQDILGEILPQEKFETPSHSGPQSQNDALIIDLGNCQCRVGWSHSSEPSIIFDTIVHRWKDEHGLGKMKIGRGVPNGPNVRPTSRGPFENGLPVHTPTIELIMDFILASCLQKSESGNEGISIVMTEVPLIPPFCRNEMLELLFEGYDCIDRVAFVLDGPSAVLSEDSSGLIIHIGAVNTHIYPVIEGGIDWIQTKRLNWGGLVAAEFLLKILGLKYPGLLNSTNPNKLTPLQAQALWQKTCLVAADLSSYETEMEALANANDSSALKVLNCCIRLTGDAASEADRVKAVEAAKKAAELNQMALQEKRRILADKLRQKSEEQRAAKIKSKEHIYRALQGLLERVHTMVAANKKSADKKGGSKSSSSAANKKKHADDEDILMDFSEDEEVDGADEQAEDEEEEQETSKDNVIFSTTNIFDPKLLEELKRLGFKSLQSLQEGLKRAEEDYFRLSGQLQQQPQNVNIDFSLLDIPDAELSEAEIREKRRLRLIKASADARERQKAEKAADDAKRQEAAEALERKRLTDLKGWRDEIYGKREEILARLIRRQKQRADRKGAAQGSRFRSLVALGGAFDDSPGGDSSAASSAMSSTGIPDSGPDDGFGLNDDDWLVYRQVSREDEEENDLQDQETLSHLEALLEAKDHSEFMIRLQEEQYASLTLLDRLCGIGLQDFEDVNSRDSIVNDSCINVNAERMRCTEGLFQPASIQGIDQAGLPEILTNLFTAYPKSVQAALCKNICVSGGAAGMPGLAARLKNEISSILPHDLVDQLNISINSDPTAPWRGIQQKLTVSSGGSCGSFNWITKKQYFDAKAKAAADLKLSLAEKQEEQPDLKKKSAKKTSSSSSSAANSESFFEVKFDKLSDKKCSNPY